MEAVVVVAVVVAVVAVVNAVEILDVVSIVTVLCLFANDDVAAWITVDLFVVLDDGLELCCLELPKLTVEADRAILVVNFILLIV